MATTVGNPPASFRRRGRPPGARTQVRWNDETRELIRATTEDLIAAGMWRPPIRAVLYRLLGFPGWSKDRYGTLCSKLGEWRDAGLFPYGVFGDESGGRFRPLTASEIEAQIRAWQEADPASLPPDGYLRALLVEHEALVAQIRDWTDDRALVVSSAGQIRRENLWTAVKDWKAMADELGAKGIRVYALVDRDVGGDDIYEAHRRWFENVICLDLKFFGLSDAQLSRLNLDPAQDWQIDGVIGLDVDWWRRRIRRLLLREAT
jgi:hypothetical protein